MHVTTEPKIYIACAYSTYIGFMLTDPGANPAWNLTQLHSIASYVPIVKIVILNNNTYLLQNNANVMIQFGSGIGAPFNSYTLGTLTSARSMAVDNSGAIYVSSSNAVYKFTKNTAADGAVSYTQSATYGSSDAGTTDGNGNAARFSSPGDMVFDSYNFLYVADVSNNSIRIISPNGDVNKIVFTSALPSFSSDKVFLSAVRNSILVNISTTTVYTFTTRNLSVNNYPFVGPYDEASPGPIENNSYAAATYAEVIDLTTS
jgi:hypothetical protein